MLPAHDVYQDFKTGKWHRYPDSYYNCRECQFCKECERQISFPDRELGSDAMNAIWHSCTRDRPCYKRLTYMERLLEEQLGVYPKSLNRIA